MNALTPYVDSLFTVIHRYPRTVVFASAAGLTLPWTIENYNKWLSLGKGTTIASLNFQTPTELTWHQGGLPHNVFGWLVAMVAHPFRRETFSTLEYVKDGNNDTWIDPTVVPERRGSRPVLGWHCLPHRQIDRLPSASYGEVYILLDHPP